MNPAHFGAVIAFSMGRGLDLLPAVAPALQQALPQALLLEGSPSA